MMMSVIMGGFSFIGTDIGGYKGNPDNNLITRWYQFAVFSPFFRGHSDAITQRREPWLFDEQTNKLIRNAIVMRYKLLPYIYTLFYQHATYGIPMWKPMFFEYPDTPNEVLDKQFMFGSNILVIPILSDYDNEKGYLPINSSWYSYYDYKKMSNGNIELENDISKIGIFIRGGSIIPMFGRLRRSGTIMRIMDPYSFLVFLDDNGYASGYFYIDDGVSWNFKDKEYILKELLFKNSTLLIGNKHKGWDCKNKIERILIIGYTNNVKDVVAIKQKNKPAESLSFVKRDDGVIEIQKTGLDIDKAYQIKLIT